MTVSTPPARPAKSGKQDRTTVVLLFVAALIAVGGIGFALGHLTAPSATAAANASGRFGGFARASLAPGQTFNASTLAGRAGVGGVTGGISGTVQSINGSTMTIQEANGTSVTVDLSGNTTYHGETPASPSAVQVGTSVTVQIDTTALASETPNPSASGALGGRTLTAKDVLITQP
ncbi:MAG TPA: hypothetical protein VGE81_02360 [Candidatus Limnocylindrales bacterium]|jgi:preprotein translocase subunit YajC